MTLDHPVNVVLLTLMAVCLVGILLSSVMVWHVNRKFKRRR